MRIWFAFFIFAVSFAAVAERLEPFDVINDDQMRGACSQAFEQAFADKQDYERRPEINMTCLFTVDMKTRRDMYNLFMVQCTKAARLQSRIETAVLRSAFDDAYSIIFRRDCLDKAVAAFHVQQERRVRRQATDLAPRQDMTYQWPKAGAVR